MKNAYKDPDMVWTYRAAVPGPAAAVAGGVHGNELAGIMVVERLRTMFDTGALAPVRGTVTLAIGNPEAVAAGVRATGEDLNRCFTRAALAGAGDTSAHVRARALAAALDGVCLGIDIHGTNVPSRPFIVVQRPMRPDDAGTLACLSADLVLRDPELVFAGEPSTLDEWFAKDGGLGICYETGVAGDTAVTARITAEVIAALAAGGWVAAPRPPLAHPPKREFVLRERILLTEVGFRFADGVGDSNFQPLASGEVIGYRGDEPVVAKEDRLLVFPKPPHLRIVGRPVGYLASKA